MLKITKKLGSITATFMIQQQISLAKEEGFIEEMMQGQKVVKVFCHEEENKEAFKKLNEQLFRDGEKANQNGNVLMPILGNVGNLMYVLLAVFGGLMVYLKTPNLSLTGVSIVSIGIIVSFLGMSRQLSQTIGQASMQVSMIAMGLAGATRVFELMDEQPEEDHGYVTLVNVKKDTEGNLIETKENTETWAWKHPHQDGTVTLTELTGDVRLEDVDFGYVPEKLVLNDVSLFAKPGQKIAFVGATGAGKTTITNLINRFYDIMDGKIRYDGINISKIKKPALRSSLGVVLQDVNLFTGSVIDNIRYGRLDATDEECIAAAKLANADDFITRLPDGYETILTGNGSSLSQGQRQLISIARAAVADPPAMILDEATSSIDTRTEALVQAGMDNLMKGRTVFVIAHRLSTVKNSDAIMVLDHGKIIERGSHESLIEQKGTYYQLYTGAFELE
jgi:ATP-binding cassette subfamily B protein